ncbi:fucose 4-O-acetylase-like acetyltransferase [Okibacterium sp. HSC-33S16]|uniref:acyltransferase family protein n=1 Tax=Okibacterium sp. HSC-33S16 TaxID=2910965 RepID=UPI0020A1EBB4|nr:acyltransferase family protein [Okibacterium sp. HSC-33S16]MCP2031903.1 fucose 4-O-acetylase-like acetyltransferase [Okibacterium sp. HSC-33S16]
MTAATGSTPKPRVPFWDNARFACIVLVVMGHGIQRITYDSDAALTVYLLIYTFHMPAFAIVSGYFTKSGPPNIRQMKRVITDILLPYLIMETIWTLVQFLVEGKRELNPTQPSWTLWFLLALGIFRLVLPYLALLRWPLAWALVISVGVGYFDNVDSTFSLARTLGILPFFVLGWQLHRWKLVERWRVVDRQTWLIRGIALALFGLWLTVLIAFIDLWRRIDLRYWFFYDDSYAGLGEDQWFAGGVRLALIVLAALMSAAFFVLLPRRETWMTQFGRYTMYVYLLHSFVLYPLRESGVLRHETLPDVWLVAMLVFAVVISVVLASSPVRRLFRPLIEPKPKWIFADHRDAAPGESRRDPTGAERNRDPHRQRPAAPPRRPE